MTEARTKLQSLLRELFEFDCADLDFGVYRIMNHKRAEIEQFIQRDLLDAVAEELSKGALAGQAAAADELREVAREVRQSLSEDAISPEGELAEPYRQTKVGRRYLELREEAAIYQARPEQETLVFNHLYAFFSRYYQDGDFISKRRYSKRERYAIPYNGEEVYLHWANKDQYYIKTFEHFTDYTFKTLDGVSVHFKLQAADVEQNNVKGEKRFFIPMIAEATWDNTAREILVPFEYRPLTKREGITYGIRNQQEKIIAEALEKLPTRLEKHIEAVTALMAERRKNAKGKSVSYLEHHLRQYTRRNTSDFFIHKNLRGFLERELDFYLKNEVLNLEEVLAGDDGRAEGGLASRSLGEGWFQLMQVIRRIALCIIVFLAQIEDFQKALWEKKKFVLSTEYCMTLDRVPEGFYPEIARNEAQIQEWERLFHIKDIAPNLFHTGGKASKSGKKARKAKLDVAFLKAHPTLVLDTCFFGQDFKDRLLASSEDLDEQTGGLLLQGENFQALSLLHGTCWGRVKCIYIDPPYNAKSSEILYKNSYKHSSWLSLMDSRFEIAKRLLCQRDGVLVVSIDEVEQEVLGQLLAKHFPGFEKTCVVVVSNPSGQQGDNFSACHEYAYFVYPADGRMITRQDRTDAPDVRPLRDVSKGNHLREDAANCFYPILVKDEQVIGFGDVCDDSFHPGSANILGKAGVTEVYPIDAQGSERKWAWARDTVETIRKELSVRWNRQRRIWDVIRTKTEFNYKTVWSHKHYSANSYGSRVLNKIFGCSMFSFPKSIHTMMDCVHAAVGNIQGAKILDYFAGSGTTAHAVLNLNAEDGGDRQYILVEMAEYFDTVLKPRIEKIMFSREWEDGRPNSNEGHSHMFKYQRLESYEDALNNIAFNDVAGQQALDLYGGDYLLRYMLDFETRDSETLLNVEKLESPFSYTLRIHRDGETSEQPVDLPETFNYLIGLHMKTRKVYNDGDRRYLVYRGANERANVVVIWRETKGWEKADFERDKKFVLEQKLTEGADDVFVNGDSFIPGAKALDPVFKRLMLGGAV